nr:MAG TPA: hypothetical protein [Caudoviricetes sp.]
MTYVNNLLPNLLLTYVNKHDILKKRGGVYGVL